MRSINDISRGLAPSSSVRDAVAYAAPVSGYSVSLKLDANEGGADIFALDEASRGYAAAGFSRYPDKSGLEKAIASRYGIDQGRVVVTAGGDDAIFRLLSSVLEPGRSIVVFEPAFEMFSKYALLCGADVIRIAWDPGTLFPREKAVDAARNASCVAFVTPSNPTGGEASIDDFTAVLDACENGLVILDSAYGEYSAANEGVLVAEALGRDNAAVVKTFSKAWGLAGARVGYAIASETVASWVRASGGPYPVSGYSLALAEAVLRNGQARMEGRVADTVLQRIALCEYFSNAGFLPYESGANFVLVRFPYGEVQAEATYGSLARDGVAVRRFSRESGLSDCLRITCPGTAEGFMVLTAALTRAARRDDGRIAQRAGGENDAGNIDSFVSLH